MKETVYFSGGPLAGWYYGVDESLRSIRFPGPFMKEILYERVEGKDRVFRHTPSGDGADSSQPRHFRAARFAHLGRYMTLMVHPDVVEARLATASVASDHDDETYVYNRPHRDAVTDLRLLDPGSDELHLAYAYDGPDEPDEVHRLAGGPSDGMWVAVSRSTSTIRTIDGGVYNREEDGRFVASQVYKAYRVKGGDLDGRLMADKSANIDDTTRTAILHGGPCEGMMAPVILGASFAIATDRDGGQHAYRLGDDGEYHYDGKLPIRAFAKFFETITSPRVSMESVVDVPETESVMLVGGPRTGEWHDVPKGSNRLELTVRNKPVVYERGGEGVFNYKGPSR